MCLAPDEATTTTTTTTTCEQQQQQQLTINARYRFKVKRTDMSNPPKVVREDILRFMKKIDKLKRMIAKRRPV